MMDQLIYWQRLSQTAQSPVHYVAHHRRYRWTAAGAHAENDVVELIEMRWSPEGLSLRTVMVVIRVTLFVV